ncbi:hypothetical protein BBP40_006967 [Aspergillus hancockii]|nr:hypothetical protein BBP40_006967 [Aspergillus hancockii]
MSLPTEPQTWTRDVFIISTDKTLLSIPAINTAFDYDFMYWTRSYPEDILKQIVDNSFCFGVYRTQSKPVGQDGSATSGNTSSTDALDQIGFARLATDNLTFAYLTDLYILPEYQGYGLGGWLIDCVDELLRPLPYLRWFMLRTSAEKSKQSYEKRLGMSVLDTSCVSEGGIMMGRKGNANMA